jgi:hypothetical protein
VIESDEKESSNTESGQSGLKTKKINNFWIFSRKIYKNAENDQRG